MVVLGGLKTTQAVIQWQWWSWSSSGQSWRPCQGLTGGKKKRNEQPAVLFKPWCFLTPWDPTIIPPCWLSELRMWKFKAFCLDYWHVLCLHPHNNFYKRYVGKRLHITVMFSLHYYCLYFFCYVFWMAPNSQSASSSLTFLLVLNSPKQDNVSICLKQTKITSSRNVVL